MSDTLAEVIREKLPIKTFIMLSKFDISSPLKLKQAAQAVGIFEDKPINNRSYMFQNSQEDDEVKFKILKHAKPNYHSDNNQGGRFQTNNYQNKYNNNQQRQNRFDSNRNWGNNNNSNNNKEERYSRVPRLSDTRYSAK